jgi:hypothetical protein
MATDQARALPPTPRRLRRRLCPDAHSFDVIEFKDGRVLQRCSAPWRQDGKPLRCVWSFLDTTGHAARTPLT